MKANILAIVIIAASLSPLAYDLGFRYWRKRQNDKRLNRRLLAYLRTQGGSNQ